MSKIFATLYNLVNLVSLYVAVAFYAITAMFGGWNV